MNEATAINAIRDSYPNGKRGLAATVPGTMAGLFLGSEIGDSLDRADNVC